MATEADEDDSELDDIYYYYYFGIRFKHHDRGHWRYLATLGGPGERDDIPSKGARRLGSYKIVR